MTEVKQIEYCGWSKCYLLTNSIVEMIITGEVGPRIIRFGFVDDENEFYKDPDSLGKTGGDEWRIYGGHRFWHAPETNPRTYQPDNQPVTLEEHDGFVRIIQPLEIETGIVKELDIYLEGNAPQVRIIHRMRNKGMWSIELAPWALTIMKVGGTAIIPLPPRGSHSDNLLPTNTLTLWAYTNMSDPRWTWGERYILLRQDNAGPQKIGIDVKDNWAAYARNGHLFLKMFKRFEDVTYPDLGSTVETFTNEFMLEVETIGPFIRLQPEGEVEHVEEWYLYDNVPTPQNDADVEAHIIPLVVKSRQHSKIEDTQT